MAENQNIEYKEIWQDEYLKWICGFANARGGRIFIGINDKQELVGVSNSHRLLEDIPNKIATMLGIVCDVNLHERDGKEFLEIIVEPSNIPIAYKGEYFMRSGATKQTLRGTALQQFLMKKMGMTWDNATIDNVSVDELDRNAIDYFIHHAIEAKRLPKESLRDDTHDILGNLDLITDEGYIKNAGILLFGKRPEKYIPGVEFKIGRFGSSESDLWFQDVIKGNILQMADKVMEFLRSKYLISPIEYDGLQRRESLEIPEDALREAIFNAIVHKDYTGAAIQMKVYADHLELWNEGTLPDGFTMESLLGKHRSRPRNRKIANAFYLAGFIETWGRGTNKIIESLTNAGIREPKFEEDCGGVSITIYRKPLDKLFQRDTLSSPKQEFLSERERCILELITSNHTISIKEISGIVGVSYKTVQRDLSRIKDLYHLGWVGSSKKGRWATID